MDKISKISLRTSFFVAVFTMLITNSSLAAVLSPEVNAELAASNLVSPALLEALQHQEHVAARIYFLTPTPPREAVNFRESHEESQVNPVVLELAQTMLPGELGLLHFDFLKALQGTVDARVVQSLLHNPYVVKIDLDTALPMLEEARWDAKALCVPTATRACVQGGRFSLEVIISSTGALAQVANSSSESAVFWFYSSTNWEVVAKVLNACAINNHFWILGAGATSTGYQLNVLDWVTGRSAGYNGGALCPIQATGQASLPGFPCS